MKVRYSVLNVPIFKPKNYHDDIISEPFRGHPLVQRPWIAHSTYSKHYGAMLFGGARSARRCDNHQPKNNHCTQLNHQFFPSIVTTTASLYLPFEPALATPIADGMLQALAHKMYVGSQMNTATSGDVAIVVSPDATLMHPKMPFTIQFLCSQAQELSIIMYVWALFSQAHGNRRMSGGRRCLL